MEIKVSEDKIVDAARLHTIADFARMSKYTYNSIQLKVALGQLDSVTIAGVVFVIKPETDFVKKKKVARKKANDNMSKV